MEILPVVLQGLCEFFVAEYSPDYGARGVTVNIHKVWKHFRLLTIVVTIFALFVLFSQWWGPVPRASSATRFHIELTLQDPSSGGPITHGDQLTLTARVFKNGVRTRGGEVFITTNVPTKRYLCEIDTFPYSRDSCTTYLPAAGYWHIVARLTSSLFPPWRYVSSATMSVNVF